MISKLFLLACFFITFLASSQSQMNIGVNQKNVHSVNSEPISIGAANDIIVAFNLFDTSMAEGDITLKRVDATGAVVWMETYTNTTIGRARVFDIATHLDMIFVAGSIKDAGINRSFIAVIDGVNGTLLNAGVFDFGSPGFHSTPLKIIYTEGDATGNSVADPGLVVVGFFSSCPPIDLFCVVNKGFVLRTDLNMNILWSRELESAASTLENYDFINGITETSDGYLLTGSVTGETAASGEFQQGVLAHKIDFLGVNQWDSSYLYGDSNDVSVDAYFDNATNEIYMLSNYSASQHFGITVLDNATGAIDPTKSWSAFSDFLNYYGFKLIKSGSSTNHLVIQGYNRDNTITGTMDQTNPFAYEFEMSSGNQLGDSYHYLLPHTEPAGDDFNFWNDLMPLIYYPDIGFLYYNTSGGSSYAFSGYRTDAAGLSNMELFSTPLNKLNQCNQVNMTFNFSLLPAWTNIQTVSSGNTFAAGVPLMLTNAPVIFTEDSCDSPMSMGSNDSDQIKLYPNPASERIYITGQAIESVQVVDVRGAIVLEQAGYNNTEGLYVGDFKSGIYFVTVQGENNMTQTFKIVKR